MRRITIVLIFSLSMPVFSQSGLFDPFDEEIMRIEQKRAADQGIFGTGLILTLSGIGLLMIPLFFSDVVNNTQHRIISAVGFGALGIGFSFTLGGGIAWGVHNNQLFTVLHKESIYRRLQQ